MIRFSVTKHFCFIYSKMVEASLNSISASWSHSSYCIQPSRLFAFSKFAEIKRNIHSKNLKTDLLKEMDKQKKTTPNAIDHLVEAKVIISCGSKESCKSHKKMTPYFGSVLVMKAILILGITMSALPLGRVENEGFYIIRAFLRSNRTESMSISRCNVNREFTGQVYTEKKWCPTTSSSAPN